MRRLHEDVAVRLQATERELLALLTNIREKSGKAEDVLAVYRELTDIRGQIEQLQGRINYLDKATSLYRTLQAWHNPKPVSQSRLSQSHLRLR